MLVLVGVGRRRDRVAGEAVRGRNGKRYGSTDFCRLIRGYVSLEVAQNFFAGQLVSHEGCFVELELPVGLVEFADSDVRVVYMIDFECAQFKVNKASFCGTDA